MAPLQALPASDVFRARLMLLLAEVRSYSAIKRDLYTTVPAIGRWKQRFQEKRLDGLVEHRHPGAPAYRVEAPAPGAGAGGHPAPAHAWIHAPVVPETGARARPEQGYRASHLAYDSLRWTSRTGQILPVP